jgi:phage terminase large subunit
MEGVDICWIEEAHSVSRESLDVLIPTIRKDGSIFFITFNPREKDAPVYTDFVLEQRPGCLTEKINWNDNPFFPKVLRDEMEYCKKYDYEKYKHIWEGEPQVIGNACIFNGKFESSTFTAPAGVNFLYGADWGFAKDPTCIIRCYELDNCLYIDKEAYGVGIEIDDTPRLFASIPGALKNKIVADSARPETISYMNNRGFCVYPAHKGPGSVEEGIEFIRSFKRIYIHEDCKNTLYEFMNYSYKTDRITGEILPIPIDKNNHCIDAVRYAVEGLRSHGDIKVRWV